MFSSQSSKFPMPPHYNSSIELMTFRSIATIRSIGLSVRLSHAGIVTKLI